MVIVRNYNSKSVLFIIFFISEGKSKLENIGPNNKITDFDLSKERYYEGIYII
jgi:hypothetical protein